MGGAGGFAQGKLSHMRASPDLAQLFYSSTGTIWRKAASLAELCQPPELQHSSFERLLVQQDVPTPTLAFSSLLLPLGHYAASIFPLL